MYTIHTNNNMVADFFKQRKELACTVKWVGAPAMEVLNTARTAIKQGAVLVSNPKIGVNLPTKQATPKNGRPALFPTKAAPPVFNPYLSVITAPPGEGEAIDFQSMKSIDEALAVYKKNAKLRFIAHNDDAIAHFQMVDVHGMMQALTTVLKIKLI